MPSNHAGAGPLRPCTATRRRPTEILGLLPIGFSVIRGRAMEAPSELALVPAIRTHPLLAMLHSLSQHLQGLR
jgi:hypothetical protein